MSPPKENINGTRSVSIGSTKPATTPKPATPPKPAKTLPKPEAERAKDDIVKGMEF